MLVIFVARAPLGNDYPRVRRIVSKFLTKMLYMDSEMLVFWIQYVVGPPSGKEEFIALNHGVSVLD